MLINRIIIIVCDILCFCLWWKMFTLLVIFDWKNTIFNDIPQAINYFSKTLYTCDILICLTVNYNIWDTIGFRLTCHWGKPQICCFIQQMLKIIRVGNHLSINPFWKDKLISFKGLLTLMCANYVFSFTFHADAVNWCTSSECHRLM